MRQIGKNVLLTGAGFSKCFGGFLGMDMHHRLFNIACQREIDPLRDALLREKDYEKVFGRLLKTGAESVAVNDAVRQLYSELDHAFERLQERKKVALRKFLEGFKALDRESGFVFTLNQDLLLERWWLGSPDICLPGLRRQDGKRVFLNNGRPFWLGDTPFNRDDGRHLYFLPTESEYKEMNVLDECTPLTYIKLHGSTNFVSKTQGSEVMVIGTEKSIQLSREPLLIGYLNLFQDIICSGNVRLFIVGYGFQDEHINGILNNALKKYSLTIFLMDPTSNVVNFVQDIKNSKHWNGFDGQGRLMFSRNVKAYFPYHLLHDIFPEHSDNDLPEWREIQYRYFERNIRP